MRCGIFHRLIIISMVKYSVNIVLPCSGYLVQYEYNQFRTGCQPVDKSNGKGERQYADLQCIAFLLSVPRTGIEPVRTFLPKGF